MPKNISLEVITLVRGAIDSKIECWKNISEAEKALGGGDVEISEDALEDLVISLNCSAQLSNKQVADWIVKVTDMETT